VADRATLKVGGVVLQLAPVQPDDVEVRRFGPESSGSESVLLGPATVGFLRDVGEEIGFNEGEVIASVIREVQAECGYPVLVVDDASTDDTVAQAEKAGATVIPLATQLGAWGATQTGMRYALRNGFERVVSMDSDGQHEAEFITHLINPVASGKADVCIGACTSRGSLLRRFAWVLMKKTSGLSLEDITSGLRAYNRRALVELAGWRATLLDYQDIGVLLLLQSRGLRIADIEVSMRARSNGPSRVFRSWFLVVYYMCHTLLLGLTKRNVPARRRRPAPAA
jgi:glycosyltransferase involved in cell wall biosynthesis